MSKSITALIGAVCVGLAACTSAPVGPAESTDYSVRYPITVTPEMRTLRVPFSGPGADLAPDSDTQLVQFAREYNEKGVGAISLSSPPNWDGVSRQVADRLVSLGVPASRILIGIDGQPQRGAEVRLTFIRYAAHTEPCGDWSESVTYTLHNRPMPNFGCALQQNIAAMIADPQDLIAPKPMGPGDVQRALDIIDKYRKGEPTLATKSEEQSGVVSQIAQ